jgi:hypothetical protein
VSCSVHDVIRFEKAGRPTVNIGTDAFIDESETQARLLGMPDYDPVWLEHPVAVLSAEQVAELAVQKAQEIVGKLTV